MHLNTELLNIQRQRDLRMEQENDVYHFKMSASVDINLPNTNTLRITHDKALRIRLKLKEDTFNCP